MGLGFYNVFTAVLEVMAFLVAVSIAIFFIRRNIIHIRRLNMKELLGWPKNDANWILVIEFSLMMAFFLMNSSDFVLMTREGDVKGYFPFSQSLFGVFNGFGDTTLHILEKGAWWFHIIGVFFL